MKNEIGQPIRYIYFPGISTHWREVAFCLHDDCVATPCLWIGNEIYDHSAKQKFHSAYQELHELRFEVNFLEIEAAVPHCEFFLSSQFERTKNQAMKMLDRLDIDGTFARLEREVVIYRTVLWAFQKITVSQPDFLISYENPHTFERYLVLKVCEFLGIPILIFNSCGVLFPLIIAKHYQSNEKLQVHSDLFDKVDFDYSKIFQMYIDAVTEKGRDDGDAMRYRSIASEKLRIKNYESEKFLLKSKVYLKRWLKYLGGNTRYRSKNQYHSVPNFMEESVGKKRLTKLLESYNNLSRDFDVSTTKFVYFPLQFEPEKTTNPDGGLFYDQFYALVALRNIVPGGVEIVVKEHPDQFLHVAKGFRGKSGGLYKNLASIRGITLVNIDMNAADLIAHSECVAVITGTAGLEASIKGKKVIVFGNPWYESCPNCYSYEPTLCYADIITANVVAEDGVRNWLDDFYRRHTIPGVLNDSFRPYFADRWRDSLDNLTVKGLSDVFRLFFRQFDRVSR